MAIGSNVYIFVDSQVRFANSTTGKASTLVWRAVAFLSMFLLLPTLIFRFSSDAAWHNLLRNLREPFFFLGILGGIIPVATAVGYFIAGEPVTPAWISFSRNQLRFGRGRDNELVISDKDASRHHARILKTQQGYLLEDLNSTNGTFVNGQPVQRVLHDGDVIQVGGTQLRFEQSRR